MPKPTDLNELREQLLESFDMLKNDPRRHNQVKELSNTAGKIIALSKLQVEYAFLRGEEPDVPFIGKTSGVPLKPNAKLLGA